MMLGITSTICSGTPAARAILIPSFTWAAMTSAYMEGASRSWGLTPRWFST
jgi:hypothetical protein